ncbi:alpha/beta hydrolase [Brevibacillus sp. WF146]|uniref:esterase/lipase family protein n=1 Tax=Brevibacillus sp. WF146 TaxID=319501 RepID=UPI0007ED4BAA|nr:alpha/beta hydrolase [Brevibacillus sp. WF146]UYZ12883.1 alpha/beta hydrolase [Brevibacillus sp. WF146]
MLMKKMHILTLSASLVTLFFFQGVMTPEAYAKSKQKTIDSIEFKQDSDNDGLTDFNELFITSTINNDTNGNGILDGDEDYDGDGLTNLEEQELGTKLDAKDSDGDGLDDKVEIVKYQTKPSVADTDGDGLKDGIEISYLGSDPLNSDENNNKKLDGDEKHKYTFPKNEFGIKGEMIGISNVPQKVIVRQTPVLLAQEIRSALTFNIVSLDPNIEFNLSIPVNEKEKNEDYVLYKYNEKKVQLEPIKEQKYSKRTNSIEVEFLGGGTFVLLSSKDFTEYVPTKEAKKGKFKKKKGKVKLNNLPLEIDAESISDDGTFKISKTVKYDDDISLDGEADDVDNTHLLESTYKIEDVYEQGDETIATATAVTTQSGKTPVILVHGLLGGADTWGFEDRWYHIGYDEPWASEPIRSYETITGESYSTHEETTYSNIDVHSITGIVDDEELGPKLIIDYGYTPNEDIFTFIYNADGTSGCVRTAANHLNSVIRELKNSVFSSSTQDVNLVGHSMGGLVSRYLVENIRSADVERVVTLGTPHFGSDQAPFGDLDRDDSELWNGSRKFENDFSKPLIGFAGWNPSYNTLVGDFGDIRNIYQTGLGVGPTKTYSSWNEYVNEKYYDKTGDYPLYGDIEDGPVNIDSALGSDYDPEEDFGDSPVEMNTRFLIWDDEFGGHSTMRKHPRTPFYVEKALTGTYDDRSKN